MVRSINKDKGLLKNYVDEMAASLVCCEIEVTPQKTVHSLKIIEYNKAFETTFAHQENKEDLTNYPLSSVLPDIRTSLNPFLEKFLDPPTDLDTININYYHPGQKAEYLLEVTFTKEYFIFIQLKKTSIPVNVNQETHILDQLFKSSEDILRLVDPDCNILMVNKPFARLACQEEAEITGLKCYETIVRREDCKEKSSCPLLPILKKNEQIEEQITLSFNGSKKHFLYHAIPILSKNGELLFFLEQFKEITTIKKKEIQYSQLLDTLSDPILLINQHADILSSNHALLVYLGYMQTPSFSHLEEIIHQDYTEEIINKIKTLSKHSFFTLQPFIKKASGEYTKNKIRVRALNHSENIFQVQFFPNLNHYIFYELEKNNGQLERTLNLSPDAISILDLKGNYIYCNQSFLDFFEIKDANDILGKNALCVIPEKYHTQYKQKFYHLIEKGSIHNNNLRYENAKREKFQLSISATITYGQNERSKAIFVIIRDNTSHQKTEEQFRFMAENIRDVIWTMDLNLRTYYVSPSIKYLTGYTPEEHIKQDIYQRFTQESADFGIAQFSSDLMKMKKGELPPDYTFTGEMSYRHKEGHEVPTEIKVSAIFNDDNEIVGIQGVSRDISARKKAEKELEQYKNQLEQLVLKRTKQLKENETRFRAIVQHLKDTVAIINPDTTITYITETAQTILGYPPDALIGHKASELIHPEDLLTITEGLNKVLEGNNDFIPTEIRGRHAEGHWVYLELVAENLIGYPGIDGIIITGRDITNQKLSELSLKRSEEKFRTIFNSTTDGITITDTDGNFIEANEMAIKRTGISKEQFFRSNLRDILNEDHRMDKFTKHLLEKGFVTFESNYINTHGDKVYLEISSRLMLLDDKQVFLHVTRDISDRKNLQRKITKTIFETEEKERKRFASDLHDQLGASLSGTKMYLNLLLKGKLDEDKQKKLLVQAKDLIAEAAASTREIAYNLKPHHLNDFGLISAVESFIQRINNVTDINIDFESKNFTEKFDETTELVLYRVIHELINNTIKHAKASEISINLTESRKKIMLFYQDNGKGFNPDDIIIKNQSNGMGLNNIINRIDSIGGKYKINSAPGEGFGCIFEINR